MNNSQAHQQNNEIDLFQLIETLWKERSLIISITLAFTLLGLGIAFTTPPKFQASTHLVQLSPENQQKLKQLSLYPSFAPRTPLDEYLQLLHSNETKAAFIKEATSEVRERIYSAQNERKNIQALSSSLNIQNNEAKKLQQTVFPYTISFNASNRALAEQELDRYLAFTALKLQEIYASRYHTLRQQSLAELQKMYKLESDKATALRKNEIVRLEENLRLAQKETQLKLNIAINAAKARYKDRIDNLTNALNTATALQIIEPINLSEINADGTKISIDLNGTKDLIYLRGTKLLRAELEQLKHNEHGYKRNNEIINLQGQLTSLEVNYKIEQLKNRTDDLAFSNTLQTIKSKLNKLNSEEFPSIELKFANTKAQASPYRLKPNRTLITLLASVIGGIIGISTALIRNTLQNRKDNKG